jgi:predicted MPP superfamily phosphohydrolase
MNMRLLLNKHVITLFVSLISVISFVSFRVATGDFLEGEQMSLIQDRSNTQTLEEDYALTFVALSDIHLKSYPSIERTRMESALQFAYTSTNQALHAIVLNGDYTDGGHDPQYFALQAVRNEYSNPITPWIVNHGNHENGRNESDSHEFFRTMFGYSIDHVFEVNGYYFITLGVHAGDRYTENQAKWLDQQIKHAVEKDPNRPVFVLIHYPATETVINSARGKNGRDVFKYVLEKYPQVIHISGHSHPALNDPRVIHQDKFTSFNNSSFYYLYMEHVEYRGVQDMASAGHFAMIKVTHDHVVHIERYVLNDDQFGQARKVGPDFVIDVKQGVGGFTYTQGWYDDGSKPYFEPNAFASVLRVGADVKIRFDQAKDNDFVYYYTIQLVNKASGSILREVKIKSMFYLYEVPSQVEYILKNHSLSIGIEYQLHIYAHNPSNRYSVPLVYDFVLS